MLLAAVFISVQLAATPTYTDAEAETVTQYAEAAREANHAPESYEAQLEAARLGYTVLLLANRWHKAEIANSILRFGRRAIQLDGEGAEGYLWAAVGIGELSLLYSVSARPEIAEEYQGTLARSLRLAPGLLHGMGLAHLGMMHTMSPQIEGLWQRTEARELLKTALRYHSKNPLVRYYAGQLAEIEGDHGKANSLLAAIGTPGGGTSYEQALAIVLKRYELQSTRLSGGSQ